VQRTNIQRHGLATPVSYSPDASFVIADLEASHTYHVFTRRCAVHFETRAPCSVIAAIQLEPELYEEGVLDQTLQCATWTEEYKPDLCSPESLGWMLRDGKSVRVLKRLGLEVADMAYTKKMMDKIEGQLWMENANADEWKKDWEEGDVFE
jgi:hypothetical protein